MPLQDRMRADIERRAAILPAEVKHWKDSADQDAAADPNKNVGKLGIHQSQIEALKIMMDGLQARQDEILGTLTPQLSDADFATRYSKLSDEIVSAHELWRIFRYIIGLHKDETLGPLVDAADLIAADCYLTCMNKVRDWQLIKEDNFRAPPLVYLEAEGSPSTASRGFGAGTLGFPLRRYRDLRLPIPLILLPSDNASSMWMLATLHHEVGHNLDQDLKLQDELKGLLLTELEKEKVSSEQQKLWWLWTGEILADAFGVLLGGAGYAHALCWWLLVLAPDQKFQTLNTEDKHPPYYIRIHLISEMLRRLQVASLDTAANSIMQTWTAQQKPAWIDPYIAVSNCVAEVFLTKPLQALGQRKLTQLVPDPADDARRVAELERYLRSGFLSPDGKLPASAKWRHVPIAAQLAFVQQETPDTTVLNKIQDRALSYLAALVRPQKMSGATGASDFFRGLMRDLELT